MLEIKKRKPGRPKNIEIREYNPKSFFAKYCVNGVECYTGYKVAPNKLDEYLERYQDETKYSIEKSLDKVVINYL
jgi:hypothetical protein